ncbi:MAG: NTP transferase domain-containing protein [Candidatus Pacebacteria bacterium]|nr:NTP transferase domain-containing protein [Candidatus Paceibacterota bacterium]PIR59542.1 MAG: mannose-1-phosphate guanylyltransferase [Candidatus Pacebacteria bacterium CG10_big_fil_rev_8_21_14_0_10_45_6]
MPHNEHVYAVLLAGGGGTRLWPKSREKTPKQFLKLFGNETMLQYTVHRITKLVPWEKIIVVTNMKYQSEVLKELPKIPKENIISEPEKKDTALAMLVGTLYARSLDKDAIIINSASDHVVSDETEFVRVMRAAVQVAAGNESMVTVGITPTHPATGFGYIKIGHDLTKLEKGLSLFSVDSFTEKPNQATARAFISTGRYFWNANMYVWSSTALINAFAKHMPEMLHQTERLTETKGTAFVELLPKIYAKSEAISIDYAISEKAENLVLIPGDFGWNDVGDWKVVYELEKRDVDGNVFLSDSNEPNVLSIGSTDNLVHANGRLVALVGIKDMVVIDTNEILMIIPKNQSQDVKKIVERLKEEKQVEYL